MKTLVVCSRYLLLAAVLLVVKGCINDPEPTPTKQLDVGSRVELASLDVGPAGGVLEVTSGSLTGLKVTIPANAYPTQQTVHIYSSPITSNSFSGDINPRTDLITYDANGVFANANITIFIPINTPEGEFAMGFYYDKENREFEGLPMSSVGDTWITVVMRKPGDFLISSIPTAKLAGKHESGFTPGRDDWDFINEGTARTSNGQLAGMTLSALWYYHMQTAKGKPPLWGAFNSEYDNPPKMWYDNVEGLQFATQTEIDFDWKKNWWGFTKDVNFAKNDFTRNAIAYSILVTKRPQLVSLTCDDGDNLPFIVYSKDISDVALSDPNFQAKTNRWIHLASDKAMSYSSATSTIAYQKQSFKYMRQCGYMGVSALVDFEKLAQIKAGADTINRIPLPLPISFSSSGKAAMGVDDKFYTLADSVSLGCSDTSAKVFIKGQTNPIGIGKSIKLSEGENIVGVLLTLPNNYGTPVWRAWKWYHIFHQENLILIGLADSGYLGDQMRYMVRSADELGFVEWYSGDGRSVLLSASDTFRVTYMKTGEYPITVSKRDNVTGKPLVTATGFAKVKKYPFSISPNTAEMLSGYGALFTTQPRYTQTLHLRYEWDMGDGQPVTSFLDSHFIAHKFTSSGTYNVKLKVFETSSNNLYGETSSSVNVTVLPRQLLTIDNLKSMRFITMVFSGFNTYSCSGPESPPKPDEDTKLYGGSGDTASTAQIVWKNNSFSTYWDQSSSYDDHGFPYRNSGDEGLRNNIFGEISFGQSEIKEIDGSYTRTKSSSSSGPNGNSGTSYEWKTALIFNNVPATFVNSDTIVFTLKGPFVKENITKIERTFVYRAYPGYYQGESRYLSTDWLNSQHTPEIKVIFYK